MAAMSFGPLGRSVMNASPRLILANDPARRTRPASVVLALFFVLLEWIRGRRIPPEREAAYHFVGIVVLLTLMVIISFNDISSPLPAINWAGR